VTQPREVLEHWFPGIVEVDIEPVERLGFSGAMVWRVGVAGGYLALRRWPVGLRGSELADMHLLQGHLATHGLPVPAPLRLPNGKTFQTFYRQFWELCTWMPGEANYWSDPQLAKLAAALTTLARLHVAAASHALPWPFVHSSVVKNRLEALELFGALELHDLRYLAQKHEGPDRSRLHSIVALLGESFNHPCFNAARWRDVQLPQQWCIKDIWHDHVLFTGDQVTGIIDFGAARYGSPSADIARLLGSMVGDDRQRWRLGIEAYESVRPLTNDERDAIGFFDSSGIVLSTANWVRWLYGSNPPLESFGRDAALNRFTTLVGRLQNFAAKAGA
jgi:Ser/Thr protein kinase RdoA (MazF antagonist)